MRWLRHADEVLRLYPPAWVVVRTPLADDVIGGYRIPAGSSVYLSSYLTHRHPEFWENPEGFDPERFTPERSAGPYPFTPSPTFVHSSFPCVLRNAADARGRWQRFGGDRRRGCGP